MLFTGTEISPARGRSYGYIYPNKEDAPFDPSDPLFGVNLRDRTIHIGILTDMLSAGAKHEK